MKPYAKSILRLSTYVLLLLCLTNILPPVFAVTQNFITAPSPDPAVTGTVTYEPATIPFMGIKLGAPSTLQSFNAWLQVIMKIFLPQSETAETPTPETASPTQPIFPAATAAPVAGMPPDGPAPPGPCTVTLPTDVTRIDGRTTHASLKPGDVVCIPAGSRRNMDIRNINGAQNNPITFTNSGGTVTFNGTDDFPIFVQNSRYVRITGSGVPGTLYGFSVDGNYTSGISTPNKTQDIELDHISIKNTNLAGIYIHTNSTCPNEQPDYDYNNDGAKDTADRITQASFTGTNYFVHHILLENTGKEALYIGANRTVYAASGQQSGQCGAITQPPLNPFLSGVFVHDVTINGTALDAIQIKGVKAPCILSGNTVSNFSKDKEAGQNGGINIGLNAQCSVIGNTISNGFGPGILFGTPENYGTPGSFTIANNVIANVGTMFAKGETRGSGIMVWHEIQEPSVISIFHNTIVNPNGKGIAYANGGGSANRISNNLIVHPGAGTTPASYIAVSSGTTVTNPYLSENLFFPSTTDAKFTGSAPYPYALSADSPAKDNANVLTDPSIILDIRGISRPQGMKSDYGAYENSPSP